MPDDTDPVDGARDLTRELEEALRETAVLEGEEGPAGVAVFPVEEPPGESEAARLETIDARLAERNRRLEAIVDGIERQEALLADLTARIGDLEARLEELSAGRD